MDLNWDETTENIKHLQSLIDWHAISDQQKWILHCITNLDWSQRQIIYF